MCAYCGETIVPVQVKKDVDNKEQSAVKVEGIRSSSSALAYLDLFFEEYDWESFAYDQSISIDEIEVLANSLKYSSADDKNTWILCFKATMVPYVYKLEGCKTILQSVIDTYKKNTTEADSIFDAYKRIAKRVSYLKVSVLSDVEKYLVKAEKYGATSEELEYMNGEIEKVKSLNVECFEQIENVPAIQQYIAEKNAQIAKELAASGINADAEYDKAKKLASEEKYVDAMRTLIALKGYADSAKMIVKLNKYYTISDVLEVGEKLYVFKKESEYNYSNLYPTEGNTILNQPLVSKIRKVLSNFADIIYYIDSANKLMSFQCSTGLCEEISANEFTNETTIKYGRRIYMIMSSYEEGETKTDLVELNLETGKIKLVLENVTSILSNAGAKLLVKVETVERFDEYNTHTYEIMMIVDALTGNVIDFDEQGMDFEGHINNHIVYTMQAPNEYNIMAGDATK